MEVPPHGDPTAPRATSAEAEAFARDACAGSPYTYCVDAILGLLGIDRLRGALVAICDYGGAAGDVALTESEADAEDQCSACGLISPSNVSKVVRLPVHTGSLPGRSGDYSIHDACELLESPAA